MLTPAVASVVFVTGEYRAALFVMVASAALLATAALVWRRCQLAFALYFRQNKAAPSTGISDEHPSCFVSLCVVIGDTEYRVVLLRSSRLSLGTLHITSKKQNYIELPQL